MKIRPSILLAVLLLALPVAAQVCGDGVVDGAEQCDDGNRGRLDGCDALCAYEQVQGLTLLELEPGPGPVECTPTTNQLGQSVSALGLQALNSALADAIAAGSLDQTLVFTGLDDPLGGTDASLEVGPVSALPDPAGPGPGLDSWHLADPDHLAPDLTPLQTLPGSLSTFRLSAGPGTLELPMLDGSFRVRDSWVLAGVGAAASLPGPPPDTLAPGFATFETLSATAAGEGLCGNVTVASLAEVPIPPDFTTGGAFACSASCSGSRSYTFCGDGQPVGPDCNSFLDLLVSGCALPAIICGRIVHPTQPDVGTDGAPPIALVPDPTTGKVTVIEPEDAYSSFFTFTSQRVHLVNSLYPIFSDGFESGDPGAWSAVIP